MLRNFTLEPVKIVTCKLLVRVDWSLKLEQNREKTTTMHKATKTQRTGEAQKRIWKRWVWKWAK